MKHLAATVLVALAAAIMAAPASADPVYPGQKAAPYKAWDLINGWARPFWSDHNVKACDGRTITVWVADDLTDTDGPAWGRGMNCQVWLSKQLVRIALRPNRYDRVFVLTACTAYFHEAGHALGLPHSAAGVMAGEGADPPTQNAWAPPACHEWVRNVWGR